MSSSNYRDFERECTLFLQRYSGQTQTAGPSTGAGPSSGTRPPRPTQYPSACPTFGGYRIPTQHLQQLQQAPTQQPTQQFQAPTQAPPQQNQARFPGQTYPSNPYGAGPYQPQGMGSQMGSQMYNGLRPTPAYTVPSTTAPNNAPLVSLFYISVNCGLVTFVNIEKLLEKSHEIV